MPALRGSRVTGGAGGGAGGAGGAGGFVTVSGGVPQGAGSGRAADPLRARGQQAEVPGAGPLLPVHGWHRPLHAHGPRHAAQLQQVPLTPDPC